LAALASAAANADAAALGSPGSLALTTGQLDPRPREWTVSPASE
jgi:hypothetical protein